MVKISGLFIGIIVMGGLLTGLYVIIGDVGTQYDISFTETNFSTFRQINETYNILNETEEEFAPVETGGLLDVAIYAYKGILVFRQTPSIMNSAIDDAVSLVGLPVWFGFMTKGVILTIIITVILSALLKKDM